MKERRGRRIMATTPPFRTRKITSHCQPASDVSALLLSDVHNQFRRLAADARRSREVFEGVCFIGYVACDPVAARRAK